MRAKIRCPICCQPVTWVDNPHRPFCSERCRVVDLGHWAMERYQVAGEPVSPGESEEAAEPAERRPAALRKDR